MTLSTPSQFIHHDVNPPQRIRVSRGTSPIRKLFEYRNGIAHCKVVPFEGKILDVDGVRALVESGKASELHEATERLLRGDRNALKALADEAGQETMRLSFRGLSGEDLHVAGKHFMIAKEALKAFRKERNRSAWRA